jgi:hypothetical protein
MRARLVRLLIVAAACAAVGPAVGTASADQIFGFCNSGYDLQANGRCISGSYLYLYGVQVGVGPFSTPGTVCAGAKTNGDGTGGNALPFRCEWVDYNGLAGFWTPGGNSNWGYATLINRSAHYVWVSGTIRAR